MNDFLDFLNFLKNEDVDIFLSEEPIDKTTIKEKPKQKEINSTRVKTATLKINKKTETESKEKTLKQKIDLSNIKTIEELQKELSNFNHPLKQTSLSMVFAKGNPNSPKVMFIGEAPGQEEDLKGIPFVSKAGQLLDKMISAIKLNEKDYYISNAINYRLPNNRAPTNDEINDFTPFLYKHIELVNPQTICVLGAVALKALLPHSNGINKTRGQWLDFKDIPTIITFHPSYLLRFNDKKKEAWEDLQNLNKKISE